MCDYKTANQLAINHLGKPDHGERQWDFVTMSHFVVSQNRGYP